ncbi:hypothetical protein KUCAC02_001520, partial [Chaenocephalus aceratus]
TPPICQAPPLEWLWPYPVSGAMQCEDREATTTGLHHYLHYAPLFCLDFPLTLHCGVSGYPGFSSTLTSDPCLGLDWVLELCWSAINTFGWRASSSTSGMGTSLPPLAHRLATKVQSGKALASGLA